MPTDCRASVAARLFVDLFPVRLRQMGTSLFQGGHAISLFVALIVASIVASVPQSVSVVFAPVNFFALALIPLRLRETDRTGRRYRGFALR